MGRLRIGAAKKEITPPVGTDLFGYIRRFGRSKGIDDPLWAHFLFLEESASQALLISLDILGLDSDFSSKAKAAISNELKIDKKTILLAAIHTHSAPGIQLFRNVGQRNKDWEEKLLPVLVKGASESLQKAKKVSMAAGSGFCLIGKNRRKEGGPVDPYFPLILFRDGKNTPIALIANLGCHPVVLTEKNLLISSDYVGFFRKHLNKLLATDMVILFFTGASGDVDPVERGSFSLASKLGKILAAEAFSTIKKMRFQSQLKIKVRESPLKIPYGWIPGKKEAKTIYEENLSRYEEALKKGERKAIKTRKAFLLWAEEIKERALNSNFPSALEVKLQCLKLGNAALLAHPFELFSSVSLYLRLKSKIENLFIVGYANGYAGYLPDESAFSEGGYEVEDAFKYCGLLPLSSQAERIFKEKALRLLNNF